MQTGSATPDGVVNSINSFEDWSVFIAGFFVGAILTFLIMGIINLIRSNWNNTDKRA